MDLVRRLRAGSPEQVFRIRRRERAFRARRRDGCGRIVRHAGAVGRGAGQRRLSASRDGQDAAALLQVDRRWNGAVSRAVLAGERETAARLRSEEHTSELQSQSNIVCRLLLEKKK